VTDVLCKRLLFSERSMDDVPDSQHMFRSGCYVVGVREWRQGDNGWEEKEQEKAEGGKGKLKEKAQTGGGVQISLPSAWTRTRTRTRQ